MPGDGYLSISAEGARDDVRILRRVDLDRRASVANDNAVGSKIAVVIDVETTGTDPDVDRVIELSLRRFRFDDAGRIVKVDRSFSWLEDPGKQLEPFIKTLVGVSDEDLLNQRIDDAAATALINSAHVRLAFNANFDRRFVERRLPATAGAAWACAMQEIDWRGRGFDGSGRSLGWILAQCGFFNDRAHRAAGDVDATIAILEHRDRNGDSALFELLETASQPTWRIAAVGAHFNVRTTLKQRGYRWNAVESVWWREVADNEREAEESWLAAHVYAPEFMPRMDAPVVREVTWETRHG